MRLRSASLLAMSLALVGSVAASAEELPVALQAQLLSKMTTYIGTLAPGDGATIKVLVVSAAPPDAPSRGAQAIAAAIGQVGKLGAYKVETKLVTFASAKKLQASVTDEKPQIVYLAPEIDEKGAQAVVEAVGTAPVVTISGVSDHVKQGVVLGFSMEEARPRVLVHLKQARKQSIEFRNGLLAHAVIVEK